MVYHHGIRVQEREKSFVAPIRSTSGLQVIIGTAPVNLAKNPYDVTNIPILLQSFSEAKEKIGYSEEYKKYTLCQSLDASFKVMNVAPIIVINVLDPKKHKKDNAESQVNVVAKQAKIEVEGILLDTLVVKNGGSTLVDGVDYVASFDDNGFVHISLIEGGTHIGATQLSVKSTSIDSSAVQARDIVGGYDVSSGKETGLELIRQVYPRFNMVPGLLLAPGWSHIPDVGIILGAKCVEINGVFTCECVLDADCTSAGATKYNAVGEWKKRNGYSSKHSVVLWPQVKVGEKQFSYSAIFAATVARNDANNDDIPNLSPSNKIMGVSAVVLDDGTEVMLDQVQANALNGQGIVTVIHSKGWRTWGNNTAAFDGMDKKIVEMIEPKDRWFNCRRFFSWWSNTFIENYFDKVDDAANYRLIESIVDSENIRGNSYVSQGKCAGARIEFIPEENSILDVLNGKIQFRQYLAPYTPAEDILNILEFDPSMLSAAISGGGN